MLRRAWPLLLLAGCQSAPPPLPAQASAPPTPTAAATPSAVATPNPVAKTGPTPPPSPRPVTIDMSVLPPAVTVGESTRLTPRLALADRVDWTLAPEDADRATLSAEGVLTGRVPGAVTAIATANGQTATARLALVDPALKARPLVPGPTQIPASQPGYFMVTSASAWPAPGVDFTTEAVLVAIADTDGEGNPRLHQPDPVLVATSPQIVVVTPERHSVFADLQASASAPGLRSFAWAIPRADAPHEVASAGPAVPWP